MHDLTVVGLGYIGLPTASMFAGGGLDVRGVDVDPAAIETINTGRAHIVEPGLDELVQHVVAEGRLFATETVAPSRAFIIAVPTPFRDGHQPDLSYVQQAAVAIAPHLVEGSLVVLESTSPIGATEQLASWLAQERPDLCIPTTHDLIDGEVRIAYCPERVLPGNILHELVHNDRIVGGLTSECAASAAELYRRVVKGECRVTTARTAEMAKLTENAFRDVNIAFANELSLIADDVDVDVWELIELANLHPRVNILQPGAGVGGHCIAVDPWFLVDASDNAQLIERARLINDAKPAYVVDQIQEVAVQGATVACFGLAYKPDIDDLRESPALEIVAQLAALGDYAVLAVEPNIDALPAALSDTSVQLVSLDEALAEADVIVGLVAHQEVRDVGLNLLVDKVVVDPAGIFREGVR